MISGKPAGWGWIAPAQGKFERWVAARRVPTDWRLRQGRTSRNVLAQATGGRRLRPCPRRNAPRTRPRSSPSFRTGAAWACVAESERHPPGDSKRPRQAGDTHVNRCTSSSIHHPTTDRGVPATAGCRACSRSDGIRTVNTDGVDRDTRTRTRHPALRQIDRSRSMTTLDRRGTIFKAMPAWRRPWPPEDLVTRSRIRPRHLRGRQGCPAGTPPVRNSPPGTWRCFLDQGRPPGRRATC